MVMTSGRGVYRPRNAPPAGGSRAPPQCPADRTGRLRLACCVVNEEWPLRPAAERFQVSHTTARRWAERYRRQGAACMSDRPSRSHHSPHRTGTRTERRIVKIRFTHRLSPARIAARLGVPTSTVHRVLPD